MMKALTQTALFLFIFCQPLLWAADRFDPQLSPIGSIAQLEGNSKKVDDDLKIYRPWFDNLVWQGDLIEYYIKDETYLTTTVNLDDPFHDTTNSDHWSALYNFSKKGNLWWDTDRKIIFLNKAKKQTAFRFNELSKEQQLLLPKELTNFIRGDRSNEISRGGELRDRASIFGAIIHSNPTYIGTPSEWIEDKDYLAFVKANNARKPEIIVGANDGMVHVFDAETGEENYAYIPSMLIDELSNIAKPDYTHHYSADGKITVKDTKLAKDYATVAVGGLGAGAKGLWALDVTYPGIASEYSNTAKNKKVIWEFKADHDSDIGHIYGKPSIVRLMGNDGKTAEDYVIVGNGFNSDSGKAALFIIDIQTGKVKKKITVGSGTPLSPNGLSMPALIDTTGDGIVDYAYAGTIDGEMYKFHFGSGKANWDASGKLFTTAEGAKTPITTTPQVARHPEGSGFLVTFATGRLFTAADLDDETKQQVYGIWDKNETLDGVPNVSEIGHVSLTEQLISNEFTVGDDSFYSVTNHPIDWTKSDGWQVQLWPGTRVITNPGLRNERIKFTITHPKTTQNWDAELDYENGGSTPEAIVDTNEDGAIDDKDTSGKAIPMIFARPNGIRSGPKFLRLAIDHDAIIHNTLRLASVGPGPVAAPPGPPPVVPPEEEICLDCPLGLTGGHFDVDTFDADFDQSETSHTHEYDDKYNTNFFDFLDATRSADTFSPLPGEEYMIVMANADLSPGARIHIGQYSWNAAVYQTMIHEKLLDWKGDPIKLTDDNSIPLVFSAADLTCADCRLGISFPTNALSSGGISSSSPDCVKSDKDWERDETKMIDGKEEKLGKKRYRDGSLLTFVIQLTDKENPLDEKYLKEQKPEDLLKELTVLSKGEIIEVELEKEIDDKDYEFGGLVPSDKAPYGMSPYSAALYWHFGACYKDYEDWLLDRADAASGAFNCTAGGGKGGKKGGKGGGSDICTVGTTGNTEVDEIIRELQSLGILATDFVSAVNNTRVFCKVKDHKDIIDAARYEAICKKDEDDNPSLLKRLENILKDVLKDKIDLGTGGGGDTGGDPEPPDITLDSTLTPITKSKVKPLPHGRKAWVTKE